MTINELHTLKTSPTHQTLIGGRHSLELLLKEIYGLKEVPEAVVAWLVQFIWVHFEHSSVEHKHLCLMLQVTHAIVKPLERQLCKCV